MNTDREQPPIPPDSGRTQIQDTDLLWIEANDGLYIWHWCTNVSGGKEDPRWIRMGLGNHHIWTGPEGVSLDPSVFFNTCCNLHGWVKRGRWIPA